MLISIARLLLIIIAFALLPLYGLWIAAGAIADRWERRRHPLR